MIEPIEPPTPIERLERKVDHLTELLTRLMVVNMILKPEVLTKDL